MQAYRRSLLVVVALAAIFSLVGAWPCPANVAPFSLGILDGFDLSEAKAVNASGQAVGDCWSDGTNSHGQWSPLSSQAFIWQEGVMTGLPLLEGYTSSTATAINASGQVLGACWNDYCCRCTWQACLWEYNPDSSAWEVTGLGSLSGYEGSTPVALNDAGLALIESHSDTTSDCPGTFSQGGVVSLVPGPDGLIVRAKFLSAGGQAVGTTCCDPSGTQLVVSDSESATSLWPGGHACPCAMNAQGELVGHICCVDGTETHGSFVWLPAAAYGLEAGMNTAMYSETEYYWSGLTSINDAGQVIEFVQPVPAAGEPATNEISILQLGGDSLVSATLDTDLNTMSTRLNATGQAIFVSEWSDEFGDYYAPYFLSVDTDLVSLDGLAGPDLSGDTWARAIGDAGEIVGRSVIGAGEPLLAVMWTPSAPANTAPVLDPVTTPQKGVVGTEVTFTATATDAESNPLTFSLVNAPTGATINATTGAFAWTPTTAGSFTFDVKVSDRRLFDTQSVTVDVSALSVSGITITRNKKDVVTVSFVVRNPGTSSASDVKIASATLDAGTLSTKTPVLLRTIRAGASRSVRLQFRTVTVGASTFTVEGTSGLGSFSASQSVTVP